MGDEQAGRRPGAGDGEGTDDELEAVLVPRAADRGLDETDDADDTSDIELDVAMEDGFDGFDGFDDLGLVEEGIATSALRRVVDGVLGRVLSGTDVRRVFGEPLTRGEVTVVPVAEVRYGFGFGGGGGEGEDGEGGGAGGGGSLGARPVGFIALTPSGARFEPIIDVSRLATVGTIVGGGLAALLLVVRGLRR